ASRLGRGYALAGNVAEAASLLKQAIEQGASVGRNAESSLTLSWLAEAYLLGGRLADAAHFGRKAYDLCQRHQERGNEAWALRLLGEIAAHAEPPEVKQAEVHYRQALALAEELGMRPLVAHCHLGLGTLYQRTGRREQAQSELATAIDMYRA